MNEYRDQLVANISAPGVGERTTTRIVRDPISLLASATGTYERISDGAAHAQVGFFKSSWTKVHLPPWKRLYIERCKSKETIDRIEFAGRYYKRANDSHPALHVDNMYAATVHGLWPRELKVWTQKPSGQVRVKEFTSGPTICIPNSTSSYNSEQKFGRLRSQKRKTRMLVVQRVAFWCLVALRVVGLERTGDGAQKNRWTDLLIGVS